MNPVIEIGTKAIQQDTAYGGVVTAESLVRAAIAALEAAGYKVLGREPTEEMVKAAGHMGNRNQNRLRYIPDALRAAHDAAPRYGEPSK